MRPLPLVLLATLACSDSTGPGSSVPATGDYRVTAATHLGTKVWDFTINSASEAGLSLTMTAGDLRSSPLVVDAPKDIEGYRGQFLGASFGTNIVLRINRPMVCEGRYFYVGTTVDARPWTSCTMVRR